MPTNFSLYQISSVSNFEFDPGEYSRFKFGDGAIAEKYGNLLCQAFIKEHLSKKPVEKQIVVVPSPYSFIPTATFPLKTQFLYTLNRWLSENSYPIAQETKVSRNTSYKEDYGELSAEERINLIGKDSFQINREFLQGKTIVFIDDIKITGSHERMILKMINQYGMENEIFLLYFAELINPKVHPNVENTLNYFAVKTIFDLEPIIKGECFMINTRIVKFILNFPFEPFVVFIQNQSEKFLNLLYDMAIGNNYHQIEAYQRNLHYIKKSLFNKVLKPI
jgi:hypothetical protein